MSSERRGTLAERKASACLGRDLLPARKLPMRRYLLGLLLITQSMAGCGGDGGGEGSAPPSAGPPPVPPPSAGPPPVPPVPPPIADGWHGRFVGTVKIGDTEYFGDALLTVDGAIRLYVGSPYVADGTVQQTRPAGSAQFVGSFHLIEGRAYGNGLIIGQGCAGTEAFRFCAGTASGAMSLAVASGNLQGEIQIPGWEDIEIWVLELAPWDHYYVLPAAHEYVAGQYREELAEFALDGDTVMNIDRAGQLFFQSAHSGCTGNGTLAPHLDGVFNVYDVALTIRNCNAPYAYLNGGFEGLATTSPGAYWDYDSFLRVWMSKQDEERPRSALTLLGRPL